MSIDLYNTEVTHYWPYEKANVTNQILRCDEPEGLHRWICGMAGVQLDNKQTFGLRCSSDLTLYVSFWDGFMALGLSVLERTDKPPYHYVAELAAHESQSDRRDA